jgi:U3 small nucleolar RNA-associated protein 14
MSGVGLGRLSLNSDSDSDSDSDSNSDSDSDSDRLDDWRLATDCCVSAEKAQKYTRLVYTVLE